MTQDFERIRMPPRWPVLIYINGYTAKIVGRSQGKDQHGKDTLRLTLEPSLELIKRYKIQPPQISQDGIINVEYPLNLIIPLNLDPVWTRYLYLLNYEGKEEEATKILVGSYQQKEIMRLKNEIIRLTVERDLALEKLGIAEGNIHRYIQDNIKLFQEPMLDQFSKLLENWKPK